MKKWLLISLLLTLALPCALRAVGDAGHSLDFSGAAPGNSVIVPYSGVMNNIKTAYTIEAWIKWDGATLPTGSWRIVDRRNYFALYIAPHANYGVFRLWFLVYPAPTGAPSVAVASTITVSNLNAWHHVAVAVQPSGTSYAAYLYIDGVQAGSATNPAFGLLSPASTTNPLNIGISWAGTGQWNGEIDEVRFWTVRRSQSQIRDNRGVPLDGGTPGMQLYYKFDDGSGTTATESTPNHLNGTVSNPATPNPTWQVSTAPIGFNLLNPNSGTFDWGNAVNLQWSVNPVVTQVDLHRSSDGGTNWELISANLANPANAIGAATDIVPMVETANALYRVSKAGDASGFDTNDTPIIWTGATFSPTLLEYEAETATLTEAMFVGVDGQAFDCQFIFSAKNTGGGEGSGLIPINVPAPGATYYLWVRMMGEGETRNSIFVSDNGGPEYAVDVPADERWHWQQTMQERNGTTPAAFYLSAGPHLIKIRGRERYCRVDRIALTNDPRPNFYSPEPNQWLNLTKPAELVGPVAIVRNTPFEITWESLNMGPLVNLEYSLDYGRTFILIDEDVQNTGSFVWSVPDTVTEEGVIRISAPLGYCPMDINWMPFYIVNPPPVVTVTAPNGGETLAAKDTTQITWSSARFDQPVSLYLSLDGGATWSEIAAGQSNTGSCTWIVPKTLSDSCLIKVKAADAEIPVDLSDALFRIVRPAGEEPSLTLTAPNGGESFEAGRVETIEWISEYLTGHVALLFSADSGRTWSEFATGLPAAGAYEWTIPATASEQCLIKVADSATGAIVDLSDAPFSISALPQNFALAFDGEDDLLQVAHHPSLNISGTMTIAFWMQNHQLGQSWSRILEKGTFDEYAISFYSNTGRLAGTLRSTIPGGVRMQTLFGPSFSIIPVREWVHVAVTYDGTTASLYINGILETSKTGKAAPRTLIRDLIIGAALHNDVYEYHFKGLLDEMSFWSVALTPEQIADRMFERPRGSEESLVAYYSFDEGSGQFAHDKGPNLLHGRLGKIADTDESDPLWISIDRPARMAALAVLEKSFAPLEEVIEQEEIPLTCELGQNYPNPFNASTTITYTVPEMPESGSLRLDIFDIQGRLIRTLAQGTAAAGSHQILWNGTNEQGEMVPSGIYFYRLQAGSFQEIKRMVMLK